MLLAGHSSQNNVTQPSGEIVAVYPQLHPEGIVTGGHTNTLLLLLESADELLLLVGHSSQNNVTQPSGETVAVYPQLQSEGVTIGGQIKLLELELLETA